VSRAHRLWLSCDEIGKAAEAVTSRELLVRILVGVSGSLVLIFGGRLIGSAIGLSSPVAVVILGFVVGVCWGSVGVLRGPR
jgi:NhaP-type Na+/H+ or K+/H+ antiporter